MTTNHQHNTKSCRAFFAGLSEYLDNELDAETRLGFEEHFRKCPPCQVCLTTLRRTVEMLRNVDQNPLPANFTQRLMSKLVGTRKTP